MTIRRFNCTVIYSLDCFFSPISLPTDRLPIDPSSCWFWRSQVDAWKGVLNVSYISQGSWDNILGEFTWCGGVAADLRPLVVMSRGHLLAFATAVFCLTNVRAAYLHMVILSHGLYGAVRTVRWVRSIWDRSKGPFKQAIFAAIFLLFMHAIKWIDLRILINWMYWTNSAKLYKSIEIEI